MCIIRLNLTFSFNMNYFHGLISCFSLPHKNACFCLFVCLFFLIWHLRLLLLRCFICRNEHINYVLYSFIYFMRIIEWLQTPLVMSSTKHVVLWPFSHSTAALHCNSFVATCTVPLLRKILNLVNRFQATLVQVTTHRYGITTVMQGNSYNDWKTPVQMNNLSRFVLF